MKHLQQPSLHSIAGLTSLCLMAVTRCGIYRILTTCPFMARVEVRALGSNFSRLSSVQSIPSFLDVMHMYGSHSDATSTVLGGLRCAAPHVPRSPVNMQGS